MKTNSTYLTRLGSRHTVNQDAVGLSHDVPAELLAQRGYLYAVADGYGPDQAGSNASASAVQALKSAFYTSQEVDTGRALVQAVQQANKAVVKATGQAGSAGSTLTAAVVQGSNLHIAHVGDSRAYLLRAGQLRRLTHDHTWGMEQVRAGKLKPEQVAKHPQRGQLTRVLGSHHALSKEQVEHVAETLQPGDILMLCTDGLSDMVPDADMAAAMRHAQADGQLAALAGQRGGTDDVSAVVVWLGEARALPGPVVLAAAGGVVLALILLLLWLWPDGRVPSSSTAIAQTGTALSAQVTAAAGSETPAPSPMAGAPTSTLAPIRPAGGAPAPNSTPTPAPIATVAPALVYPAPVLSGPEDNAEFRGRDTPIHLQWRSAGPLAAGDAYVVVIDFPHDGAVWHDSQMSTATEIEVPRHVYDNLGGDRRLTWRVAVWRNPVVGSDGLLMGIQVGEESSKRTFVWKQAGDELATPPIITPTATPGFEG